MFISASSYKDSYLSKNSVSRARRIALNFESLYAETIEDVDDEAESDLVVYEESDNDDDEDMNELLKIQGATMCRSAAVRKYCNGGRTNLGAKSRAKRFFGAAKRSYSCHSSNCTRPSCPKISVGQQIRSKFVFKKKLTIAKKAKKSIRSSGMVLFMSVRYEGAKTVRIPSSSLCTQHEDGPRYWVKINGLGIVNCKILHLSSSLKRRVRVIESESD